MNIISEIEGAVASAYGEVAGEVKTKLNEAEQHLSQAKTKVETLVHDAFDQAVGVVSSPQVTGELKAIGTKLYNDILAALEHKTA